ncbi:MAG: oligosaccharide flippase family protein [Proteobacteria bacterium]|nr:oligosaccharide flippase family protein [Pseudomonadota bacterium]
MTAKGKRGQTRTDSLSGTIAHYATSVVAKQALGVLNAYLKPLLLSPAAYGLWNLLNTVLAFIPLTHLGSRSAMRYRIPANEARGDEAANEQVLGAVFYGTLVLTGIAAVGLGAAAVFVQTGLAERLGLLVMAVVMIITWLSEFHVAVFKARSRFTPISTANYISAVTACVLNAVLILAFGLYGLFTALIATNLLVLWYLHSHAPHLSLGRFRWSVFRELVREGFPIITFSLGATLIRTVDRFIISAWLGLEALGYYGIAIMALNFLMRIPDASREVVEPLLMHDLQTRPERDCLRDYVERPLLATAYALPLLLGPAMLLLPAAVELLLPRYAQGVPAAQILTGGCLFLSLAFVLRGILIARNLQVRATGIMLVSVAGNLVLSIGFLTLGLDIAGVALASACSFLLLFGGLWIFVRRHEAELSSPSWAALLAPLALAAAATGAARAVDVLLGVSPLISGPIGCVLFLGVAIPLFNRMGRLSGHWEALTLQNIGKRFR